MQHPGFFERSGPMLVSELAAKTGTSVQGSGDVYVSDVMPLDAAGEGHVSFFENIRYASQFAQTRATACFVSAKNVSRAPASTTSLVTKEPYRAFAQALKLFYPDARFPKLGLGDLSVRTGDTVAPPSLPRDEIGGMPCAHGRTFIHPSARLEAGVEVEPGAIIGAEAQVGAGSRISAGAVIGYRVYIGRDCFVGPRAVITHALIGNSVIIHAGVAIGQDGFGFAMGAGGHFKVPQIGRVIIQDNVEIGANTTIDRGALRDTIIGEGTKIDNLVQIAHNVVIGRHCIIVGQAGISGSTVLEDFVVMGGQSGVVGHVRLGAGSQIAGNSGVAESIPRGERWGGTPAKPLGLWAREVALMKRLVSRHVKDLKAAGKGGESDG